MLLRAFFLLVLLVAAGAAAQMSGNDAQIDAGRLSAIVQVLASDEFEGRAPAGPGEARTVAYLVDRFKALGLQPGAGQGRWTQPVSLLHTRIETPASIAFDIGGTHQVLTQAVDIAVETRREQPQLTIADAPLVFVGFGASAPERHWDDYGDIDLNGKVAVFLVNDPDYAAGPDEEVAGLFGGKRMTYYGRWTYKFEEAERRGALAALVIHEDGAAGYGWSVASSGPGDNLSLLRAAGETAPLALQGWLSNAAAEDLFAAEGLDLEQQRALARRPDFRAFELKGATLSAALSVATERVESQNVLAVLPGSTYPQETLMVSAHWDAYGHGAPDDRGRTVRPGANDDALGTAGVLELARVLKAGAPLQRSVVFAVWTAEESGLLGSAAYAAHPVYPLAKTVANFTMDILQTAGPARDVILVGQGQSNLEHDLARAAAAQGRVVTPESLPENGLFFRADHFSLARAGVPVLLLMGIAGGADLVDGGRAAGDAWIKQYVGHCYHQTCDQWSADWDLRGAVADVELLHAIVRQLGNSRRWPRWQPDSEFAAVRAASDAVRAGDAAQ